MFQALFSKAMNWGPKPEEALPWHCLVAPIQTYPKQLQLQFQQLYAQTKKASTKAMRATFKTINWLWKTNSKQLLQPKHPWLELRSVFSKDLNSWSWRSRLGQTILDRLKTKKRPQKSNYYLDTQRYGNIHNGIDAEPSDPSCTLRHITRCCNICITDYCMLPLRRFQSCHLVGGSASCCSFLLRLTSSSCATCGTPELQLLAWRTAWGQWLRCRAFPLPAPAGRWARWG